MADEKKKDVDNTPFVDVDLGNNGGRVVFRTVDEANDWLSSELNFWSWLSTAAKADAPVGSISKAQINILQNLQNRFQTAAQHFPNPRFYEEVKKFEHELQASFVQGETLYSSTPEAKFVDEIKNSDTSDAAYALAYFSNIPTNLNEPRVLRGMFQAHLFREGFKYTTKGEREALAQVRHEFSEAIAAATDTKVSLDKAVEQAGDDFYQLTEEQKTAFTDMAEKFERDYSINLNMFRDQTARAVSKELGGS